MYVFFSSKTTVQSHATGIKEEQTDTVTEFKYLGLTHDPNVVFKNILDVVSHLVQPTRSRTPRFYLHHLLGGQAASFYKQTRKALD